jgi:hypothetical protein
MRLHMILWQVAGLSSVLFVAIQAVAMNSALSLDVTKREARWLDQRYPVIWFEWSCIGGDRVVVSTRWAKPALLNRSGRLNFSNKWLAHERSKLERREVPKLMDPEFVINNPGAVADSLLVGFPFRMVSFRLADVPDARVRQYYQGEFAIVVQKLLVMSRDRLPKLDPTGVLLNLAVCVVGGASLVLPFHVCVYYQRRRKSSCASCGYLTAGLDGRSTCCPECGRQWR